VPSASWTDLRGWLTQFDDPDVDDVESLNDLIDRQLRPVGIPADLKVLSLVRWLDADLPAVYRGLSMSRADLPAVAALAATAGRPGADPSGDAAGATAAARVVEDLWLHEVLPRLALMHGGDGLDDVHRAWRALVDRYESRLRELTPGWPAEARSAVRDAGTRPYAVLLEQALDPTGQGTRLREQVRADVRLLPAQVPWFSALAGDDPVTDALRLAVYPAAAQEAERLAQEERERRAVVEGRRLAWEEAERRRVAGTAEAANRARLYAGAVVAAMALIMLLGVRGRSDLQNVLGLLTGVVVGLLLVLQEVALAERLGGDYAYHQPLSGLGARLSSAGSAMRGGGDERWLVGVAVLVGGLVAVLVSLSFPVVPFVAIGAGYLWLVERRRRAWEQQHRLAARLARGEE
jgi:hypothetical protein